MKDIYAIDTNLLVLLVVGTASKKFISSHKRTNYYTEEDFCLLERMISFADSIVVKPNVLTETSNLMRQFREPGLSDIMDVYKCIVAWTRELYVKSSDVVGSESFSRLGLADAAQLTLQSEEITILTDDLDLYVASVTAGKKAINFSHERESWLRV